MGIPHSPFCSIQECWHRRIVDCQLCLHLSPEIEDCESFKLTFNPFQKKNMTFHELEIEGF